MDNPFILITSTFGMCAIIYALARIIRYLVQSYYDKNPTTAEAQANGFRHAYKKIKRRLIMKNTPTRVCLYNKITLIFICLLGIAFILCGCNPLTPEEAYQKGFEEGYDSGHSDAMMDLEGAVFYE